MKKLCRSICCPYQEDYRAALEPPNPLVNALAGLRAMETKPEMRQEVRGANADVEQEPKEKTDETKKDPESSTQQQLPWVRLSSSGSD